MTSQGTQEPYNTVDCSDPLMAGSAQCAQQTQGREFNLPAGSQTLSPGALPSGQLPGNVSYRDNGTLTSQSRNQALRTSFHRNRSPNFKSS